jgi:predicted AAA+ superfamily ATPase
MSSEPFYLGYGECLDTLRRRLAEGAPGRIQLLAGPRQVGKTTLLLALAAEVAPAAVYAAADAPEATLPGFWERIVDRAETTAAAEGRATLLLDEAHLLPDWAARLKGVWDRWRRRKTPVHVVATGSSALHLAAASRESLAGRFERLTLTHWSASSLVEAFGVGADEAADIVVRMGSYPGAFGLRHDVGRWAAYVRDAIVEPAIGRDLLALNAVRRPALLRQVFGVAVSSPAQIVTLQKIQGLLRDKGALETIQHYLGLLEEGFLIAALPKYSKDARRRRASPPKLVALNNALLAATDPGGPVDRSADAARFGAWVENACLAHAWNAGQRVSYWREEPLEVDGVIEGSWGKWAVEVKTGAFSARELVGLMELTRRHKELKPLVLCDEAGVEGVFGGAVSSSGSGPRDALDAILQRGNKMPNGKAQAPRQNDDLFRLGLAADASAAQEGSQSCLRRRRIRLDRSHRVRGRSARGARLVAQTVAARGRCFVRRVHEGDGGDSAQAESKGGMIVATLDTGALVAMERQKARGVLPGRARPRRLKLARGAAGPQVLDEEGLALGPLDRGIETARAELGVELLGAERRDKPGPFVHRPVEQCFPCFRDLLGGEGCYLLGSELRDLFGMEGSRGARRAWDEFAAPGELCDDRVRLGVFGRHVDALRDEVALELLGVEGRDSIGFVVYELVDERVVNLGGFAGSRGSHVFRCLLHRAFPPRRAGCGIA